MIKITADVGFDVLNNKTISKSVTLTESQAQEYIQNAVVHMGYTQAVKFVKKYKTSK